MFPRLLVVSTFLFSLYNTLYDCSVGKLFAEMKTVNLTFFVFNSFLFNVCSCSLKKLGELFNMMRISQEKKRLILGKIDNHIRIAV